MKFKPIHWILIVVLLIEACILGICLGTRNKSAATVSTPAELLLTYDTNEDGSFTLLSLFANADEPEITFQYGEKQYVYDSPLVELVDAYRQFEKFKTLEPTATEDLWIEFQEHVSTAINARTNQEHAAIEYIRNIASSGYNVPHEQLHNNMGYYTINATTTINNWNDIFADYIIKDDSGNVPTELAMGATVRIDETDHNAIVYTVVNSDSDTKNNSTAPEVSVHILFGDYILDDINLSNATIYYLRPDGSEYFAHSDVKLHYLAAGNEARYRDILILGGLQ